jgi:2-keto-4-pentenoate hydratase/2-oxohepta-3-ene-1,7-dioic acid hydratase in catechol pathway
MVHKWVIIGSLCRGKAMRLATFQIAGERRVGLVDVDAGTVAAFDLTVDQARLGLLAVIGLKALPRTLSPVPLSQVTLEAPIPRPARNIFCVGKNYHAHAAEFAASGFDSSAAAGVVPAHPIIFSKVPECVVAHHAPVWIDPKVSTAIDYEAELAVIIGVSGRAISRADAMSHVWGYTIINDVTARDLQGKYSQWLIGKSQDTFGPMGPWAVTADAFDLSMAGVKCWVNGDLRQDARFSQLIFDIPTLIETLSAGITLQPGDIIATGTPAGVGIGHSPPVYLKHGDVVRIAVDGIGTLENRVEARG